MKNTIIWVSTMKKFILTLCIISAASCATVQTDSSSSTAPEDETGVSSDTVQETEEVSGIETADQIMKKYRKEGFVDRDTYSIIIVRPADTMDSQADILSQAKKRTLVSFTKYIRQQGKIVDSNTNASLLNLINDYGSLKRVEDSKNTRIVYVFIVKRDQLKRYIDGL